MQTPFEVQGERRTALSSRALTFTSADTNDTFASSVCGITDAEVIVNFNGILPASYKLLWPRCMGASSTMTSLLISGVSVIFEDFTTLPTGLTSFTCNSNPGAIFQAQNGSSVGFDATGKLAWSQIFNRLPSLHTWSMSNALTQGSTLPNGLPSSFRVFQCTNCGLVGGLTSTLFSALSFASGSFTLDISQNLLAGTMPSDFFTPFAGQSFSNFGSLYLMFGSNQLSGSLPNSVLTPFSTASVGVFFQLGLENNRFSGNFPGMPFISSLSYSRVIIDVSQNTFGGPLPVFTSVKPSLSLFFNAKSNGFTGELPSTLFGPQGWTGTLAGVGISFDLSNNSLTGTIPPELVVGSFAGNVSCDVLTILLNDNDLTGTIPQTLLRYNSSLGTSVQTGLQLGISRNKLNGTIPESLIVKPFIQSTLFFISLEYAGNDLNGVFPEAWLSEVGNNAIVDIDASNNFLWGSPPAFCSSSTSLSLNMSSNALNGTLPSAWDSTCVFSSIDLSLNQGLTGNISPIFSQTTEDMVFIAHHTGLVGEMPAVAANNYMVIDLSFTNVSFCSASNAISSFANFSGVCLFACTDASECPSSYSMCDTTACGAIPPSVPPAAPLAATIPPVTGGEPLTTPAEAPVATPLTSPVSSSTPFGCPANTRPSLEFVCINGVWTAQSVNSTTLVIPSGAGNIVVTGNVTSTSIVINGIGTTVIIDGCATNLTNIVVEIDAEEIAKLGSKLIQELLNLKNGQNCTDLANVGVSTLVKGSSCKKVKANKVFSGNTLSAAFTVDTSGCNKWWIILVSVICGVVVIGVIAAVVAIHLVNKKKEANASKFLKQSNTG